MAWLLGEALRDGFRRGEGIALVAAYLAPALFKVTAFDNALKLSVIAASALLFVVVLRRMTDVSADYSLTKPGTKLPAEALQDCSVRAAIHPAVRKHSTPMPTPANTSLK
jgi:hypothetical protein